MLNVISGILNGGAAPDLGAYEAIQTYTVGAGGSSTISLTSIPSTYTHLQLRCLDLGNANQIYMRINSDTGNNYSWHNLTGDGSSASAGAGANTSIITLNFAVPTTTSSPMVHIIDFLDYANTNKYKTIRGLTGIDTNGSGEITLNSGNWRSTAAINTISFSTSSNPFSQYSSFALYGIKG